LRRLAASRPTRDVTPENCAGTNFGKFPNTGDGRSFRLREQNLLARGAGSDAPKARSCKSVPKTRARGAGASDGAVSRGFHVLCASLRTGDSPDTAARPLRVSADSDSSGSSRRQLREVIGQRDRLAPRVEPVLVAACPVARKRVEQVRISAQRRQ
jgi:hypothetical protein